MAKRKQEPARKHSRNLARKCNFETIRFSMQNGASNSEQTPFLKTQGSSRLQSEFIRKTTPEYCRLCLALCSLLVALRPRTTEKI
jgi:hypothetical protein